MIPQTKPKLLVLELWALGDLSMATPFLRAATEKYDVTLLAKSTAVDLQPRLWPNVSVIPFTFHWTHFKQLDKYALHRWKWGPLFQVLKQLRAQQFDIGISVRLDPRDHFLLRLVGAKERVGFPVWHSDLFLSRPLPLPSRDTLRHEYWRLLGQALGLNVPLGAISKPARAGAKIIIHCGAAQPTRIWPLERFGLAAQQLRAEGFDVSVLCDKDQEAWWLAHGEKPGVPADISQLTSALAEGAAFIGNDSGPGHLSGAMGIPTFTIFGNQFSARFAPLAPEAETVEGRACPYKPCFDQCRFAEPRCLYDVTFEEVWPRMLGFARKHAKPVASP